MAVGDGGGGCKSEGVKKEGISNVTKERVFEMEGSTTHRGTQDMINNGTELTFMKYAQAVTPRRDHTHENVL